MPKNGVAMEITSESNYACLYTTDFQSHTKSNIYLLHLNYVQLYETLHLEIAAHFQKVTETGPSLKQVILRLCQDTILIRNDVIERIKYADKRYMRDYCLH